jgi:DNA-directed RNA polymerase specialized sigma24 family protein
VPSSDVEDVVQTVFCDALAAPERPTETAELTRWLLGIARHKVVDRHRRATREPPAELPEIPASPAPIEARALVRWAERQAGDKGDAQRTLGWMAREGEGEKLDAIAADEKVPAARVRQRVSRMRRWMKERWAAELAAVAVLAAFALAAWWLLRKQAPPVAHDEPAPMPTITPELPSPVDRARVLRADALRACDRGEWRTCLDGLDRAKALDPDGDQRPEVGAARTRAEERLRDVAVPPPDAPPTPSAKPGPLPTTSFVSPPEPTAVMPKKAAPMKLEGTKEDTKKPEATPKGGSGKRDSLKKRASSKVLDSPDWQ